MQRRLAVIVFLLAIAGNVWAGVCHCLDDGDHSSASCCKRKFDAEPSFSAKPCCGDECGQSNTSVVRAVQTDQLTKVSFTLQPIDSFDFRPEIDPGGANAYVSGCTAAALRVPLPRPPDLYLIHRSILI